MGSKRGRKIRVGDVEDVDEGIELRDVRREVEQSALLGLHVRANFNTNISVQRHNISLS
jgi:hypothetical protein